MANTFESITPVLQSWIEAQHMFFVATAPLAEEGLVNCSPKGMDSLRILGTREVAYLDLTGSGVETIAHVFPDHPGARAIIRVKLVRISDSCGYSVPRFDYAGERDGLVRWAVNKGDAGLDAYRADNTATSLEGLPGYPTLLQQ